MSLSTQRLEPVSFLLPSISVPAHSVSFGAHLVVGVTDDEAAVDEVTELVLRAFVARQRRQVRSSSASFPQI